jgi:hypothetical protein
VCHELEDLVGDGFSFFPLQGLFLNSELICMKNLYLDLVRLFALVICPVTRPPSTQDGANNESNIHAWTGICTHDSVVWTGEVTSCSWPFGHCDQSFPSLCTSITFPRICKKMDEIFYPQRLHYTFSEYDINYSGTNRSILFVARVNVLRNIL